MGATVEPPARPGPGRVAMGPVVQGNTLGQLLGPAAVGAAAQAAGGPAAAVLVALAGLLGAGFAGALEARRSVLRPEA